MHIPIFKIFAVFGIVSAWSAKALEDGKITATEAVDLATQLGASLGIPTSIQITPPPQQPEQTEEQPPNKEPTQDEEISPKLQTIDH